VHLTCVRCLKGFVLPIVSDFRVSFLDNSLAPVEEDREISTDELNVGFLEEGILDIGDVVEEQLWLNIPMQPCCDPGCKGLCPICGQDLNEGQCTCNTTSADPRFAVLEKLRSSLPQRRR
jgi:uncharacterized protein